MKKLISILMILFLVSPLYAVDYSEMSTQELIEIMGYVKKKNEKKFNRELRSRVSTMNDKERQKYQENLKRLKQRR